MCKTTSFFLPQLVFLILLALGASGQSPAPSVQSYTTSYQLRSDLSSNPVIRQFVKEIARGKMKSVDQIRFEVSLQIKVDVAVMPGSPTAGTGEVLGMKCDGDITYKGFDLSDYLFPSQLIYHVVLSDTDCPLADTLRFDQSTKGQPLSTTTLLPTHLCTYGEPYTAEFSSLSPVYSEEDLMRFYRILTVIDEYYASAACLDTVISVLEKINIGNGSIHFEEVLLLAGSENILHHLQKKKAGFIPLLLQSDPGYYTQKMNRCRSEFDRGLGRLQSKWSAHGKHDTGFSVDLFARRYAGLSLHNISRSYATGFYLAPFYQSLAVVDFSNARLAFFQTVLDTYPGTGNRFNQSLALSLYRAYMAAGDTLMARQFFNDALILYGNAGQLCKKVLRNHCREEIDGLQTHAVEGISDSYLVLSSAFLQVNDLGSSEQYLIKASEILDSYPELPLSKAALQENARAHITWYEGSGDLQLKEDNKENAAGCYRKALALNNTYLNDTVIFLHLLDKLLMINGEIYQQLLQEWKAALDEGNIELAGSLAARTILLAESNLSDTLYAGQAMGIIRQVREYNYRQLLDESDLLIQQDAIPEALGKLQEAAELAATFEIPESPVYSELLSRVYKPVLLEKLSKGRMHAWLNDLDLAQGILDECLDIAVRYGLDRDPEISEVLDGLRSMIREKKNANNP